MKKIYKKLMGFVVALATVIAIVPTTVLAADAPVMPEKGTLVIHKYKIDDPSEILTDNRGEEIKDGSLDAYEGLDGITFKAVWVKPNADGSYPEDAAFVTEAQLDETKSYTAITSSGVARMEDMTAGVYLVKEISSPGYAPIAPFLVQVPMTNKAGDGWLDTVHVYPKNQTMNPSKTADSNQFDPLNPAVKNTVTWTIQVPTPVDVSGITVYKITDVIDSQLILENDSMITVTTVSDRQAAGPGTTVPEGYYTIGRSNNTLTVEFTDAGIAYLGSRYKANEPYVRVIFDTTISNAALGQIIDNQVQYEFGNDTSTTTKQIPDSEKPSVYTGAIRIKKTKQNGEGLAGAVFKVATSEANAKAGIFCKGPDGNDLVATSGNDGIAVIKGISYGTANQRPDDAAAHGNTKFYVVEVQAPTGYNLLHAPIEVGFNYEKVTENGKTVNYFNNGKNGATEWTVVNTKGFTLPGTGSTGIVVSTIVGVLILGAVIVTVTRRRTRSEQ